MMTTSSAIVTSSENVTINGGNFTVITPGERGLEKITNSASPNAFYDSAANYPPLDKHPDVERYTCIAMDWIWSQDTPILWIAGKSKVLTSLIATSTAEFCGSDQQQNLLTTFFFSKGDPSRNSAKHFTASLAYGIIQSIPASRGAIRQAVDKDPLLLSSSIEKQFDKLIWNPLNHLYHRGAEHAEDSTFPHVMIINSLDECEDVSDRRQIMRLFGRFYTPGLNGHHRDRLPWKVLFTSEFDQTMADAIATLQVHDSELFSVVFLPEIRGECDLPGGLTPADSESPSSHGPNLAPQIPVGSSGQSIGLRLLSIDGGGMRGLSTLVILEEIMHRFQSSMNLRLPPKPYELFDLAGGTGTGGLIVILLFRLRMSAREAIDTYVGFMKYVFSERKGLFHGATFKASRLEEALLDLISSQLGISIGEARTERMVDETSPKCFVCASPTQHDREPTLFRTWDYQISHRNVTILEAARATLTLPRLFKSTEIAVGENVETFINAGYWCNNPIKHVLEETLDTLVAVPYCFVSLGTGLESIIALHSPDAFERLLSTQLIQVFKTVARDCERVAKTFENHIPVDTFRLNVGRGMHSISLEEWEMSSDVVARTQQYLLEDRVRQRVDELVNMLRHYYVLSS